MDFAEYFQGKKITVMGLGLLGRGVGDAAFLAECGAELIVTDLKSEIFLADSLAKLEHHKNITFVLGEHRKEDFEGRDMILVAAGVPMDSEYLEHARSAGVRLVQSAALFAEISKIPIIGITGTRGKSTVTAMVHHVLSVVTGEHIIKGGNIRGVSNLQLLKEVKEDSVAVLELDSWQLQGFGWAGISPHIAVFTNFMKDHMNYYHNDMNAYFADKANIFRFQEESGVLVTTPEVFEQAKALPGITLGQEVVLVDSSLIPEDAVKIYNDNNSTTPTATIEGLKAIGKEKDVVLIVGGTDKGIESEKLSKAIEQYCAHVILYSGTGTEELKKTLPPEVSVEEHDTLSACVEAAMATSVSGNVILFSPGYASFGKEFKNEYQRNDSFIQLISQYVTS